MNNKNAKEVIRRIAEKEGKQECEIREEMKKAILAGFMNPETKNQWTNLFGEGRLPNPEEFIAKLSDRVIRA